MRTPTKPRRFVAKNKNTMHSKTYQSYLHNQYSKENQAISDQIDFNKLPSGEQLEIKNGVVYVDPANKNHRRWLED